MYLVTTYKTDPAYEKYVHMNDSGKLVLYVTVKKAVYGCFRSARLFYENLVPHLVSIGFLINLYNLCVANQKINRKQSTITWHVDNLKIYHKDRNVVDNN